MCKCSRYYSLYKSLSTATNLTRHDIAEILIMLELITNQLINLLARTMKL